MADYFVDYNGNITKNKKKKKQPTYIVSSDGTITKNKISPQSSKVNDIAPVKTDEDQKWYQGWLKKSEGNFGQAVKASGVDLAEDATIGVVGSGEKLLDSLMAFAPAMNNLNKINSGQMLDAEDWKEHDKQKKVSEEFIKKDLYDEAEVAKKIITTPFEKRTGIDVESMSVFDKKADSLAQSGGQMGVTALVSLANPMLGTAMLGGTSFGSEMENALNKGAAYDEAMLSSAITAGAEMLTEKISGGISLGGKTLDDLIPVDKLAQGISNKVVRNLINIGVDATGEGFEEIVSGVLSAVGQKMTYMEEKELKELFSSEEALESFLGGAILGGISSTGKTAIDTVKGKDSLSGLSKNEKAVFDKVYNDAIAEKESDGKKLTQKEKNKIYDDTLEKLEKGRIDTDTIGSMFAEDSYKKYKESAEKEEADLEAPTAKLEELKNKLQALDGEPDTVGNAKRYDAIERQIEETEKQIEEIKKNSGKFQLQEKMDSEAFELLKGTKLAESYNEKARRRQRFEADLTKYDEKQQAVIKKAVESGILNNTNKTHEFVDMIAKISADKGVSFDFTNNTKLKDTGFAIEGKTVNGYIKDGNVAVNIDSTKALNTVVGHEITHVLEGTELYTELQNAIKEYATLKGEYDSKFKTISSLYDGRFKGTPEEIKAKFENEVTADLVGEYLFTDSDFINNLSATKPNVFKKIYEEIKYLYKLATAGSKEARELEKVKRAFDKAYKETANTSKTTDYHVSSTFAEEIEKTLNNTMDKSNQVKARDYTPKILVESGVKDLPMLITQRHIKSIVYTEEEAKNLGLPTGGKNHYHGLGKDLLIQSIDNMDSPLEIYKQDADHYLIITEMKNSDGDNVIIPIKIDGKGTYNDVYIDENQISSVYGKNNLKQYLARNNFENVYKKRENALNEGFQLPNISDSSKNSISQNKKNTTGNYNVYGKDIALETSENGENTAEISKNSEKISETAPKNTVFDDYAPLTEEEANERDAMQGDGLYDLNDFDMPEEVEAPYYEETVESTEAISPFEDKDIQDVGNRKQKAYMYENPEVKPYFQAEANVMLGELRNSVKGEKHFNDQLYYDTNGEQGWFGTQRFTSDDIAYLLDTFNYTYKDVEKGLKAIIEDNGKENNAISKRIEFLIDERLRTGYTEFMFGDKIPPNQDYINLLNSKEITQYDDESWNNWLRNLSEEDVATLSQTREDVAPPTEYIPAMIEPKGEYISIRPKQSKGEPRMARVKLSETDVAPIKEDSPIAQVLTEEPAPENKKSRFWEQAMEFVADKGFVFENLSKKTKNRELEAKWNYIRYADGKAQDFIGNGAEGVKALNDIQKEVTQSGLYKELSEYVYHLHNIDRMNLSERYEDAENKPVFGDSVTADVSRSAVAELEARHPELKRYANEIYSVNNYLRGLLVEGGVISQETADLWAEMYPHYVPIRRAGDHSLHINVPLDTGRTGINAPVKKATGGSSDILPLFDTMAQRALQTYKAVAKNRFGVELKNTLGTTIGTEIADVDSVIDGVEQNEELLQKGKNGRKPTFTVFEGGEKVTFEITETMYDALKPTSEALTYTNKVANKLSNFHRGVLTEYNPAFLARNIIKDAQDVLINSQHPIKTYANFPKAIKEITTKGEMYKEYVKNGGEQNSYFDKKTNTFVKDKSKFVKAVGMPLNAISEANNFIEKLPRLAEYIASREAGRSIEVSMLDSARVTTNFSAGGDLTKFANRNGATFLNASVQGAMQQVRNVREAKMNGLKGWTQLATKCAVAGLPVVLLNSLLWDDDEEYAELSDYVKQNYYIVAKYGDGKFVRIPKGRTLSVIQNALEQTMNAVTGKDEVDLQNFLQLAVSNLAPNNPIENNILAPIIQVKNNETWYGDDLVPTRLQDLPAEEQFDESTDSISRWLGEKTGFSPYKINYLLDQYTGGVGDSVLPMLTPEAESEEDTTIGKLTAPIRSSFTTDSVLKNQNVSDFYDKKDELTTNAKGKGATDKDVLSNKYFNSVNTEIGKLYGEKRDIQSGNYTDSEKYYYVRDIQRKINSLAEEALNEYDKVTIDGSYATVGGKHYKLTDDGWEKITDDQVVKMKEVMSGLGITAGEYWGNKQEYDMKYKYPEKYKVLQEQGISVEEYKENFEETAFIYTDDYSWASDNPEKYTISKVISDDVRVYKQYTSELNAIRGDDAKEQKKNYIFNLDNLDYGQKALLYRSIYSSKEDKKKYNADILEYLNNRDDISYEEKLTILESLDFKVYSDGTVEW